MSRTIAQITVLVREYDEAIDYYTRVLGFTLLEDSKDEDQDKRWVRVAPEPTSAFSLVLARATNEEQAQLVGNQCGGGVFLFLNTDDIWRDYHGFRENGVSFAQPPVAHAYGTVAVFSDLYGNLWDLIERKA